MPVSYLVLTHFVCGGSLGWPLYCSNLPKYKRDFALKVRQLRMHEGLRQLSGQTQLVITRNNIFEDSFQVVMQNAPEMLKRRVFIKFAGEEGLDYGGVQRCVLVGQSDT